MYRRFICRGGPLWPPVVPKHIIRGTGGHGGPPLQLHRSRINTLIIAIAVVLLAFGSIVAQEPEESFAGFMHGIRANAVKGDVVYQRNDATFPLESGLKLEIGDVIKTAPGACAELLLQPGNYLRASADTELQIINDQYDRMRIKLSRGTISVEVLSRDNLDPHYEARYLIRVMTPGAGIFISDPGIFRISTSPAGPTELIVRNGSAVIK